MATSSRIIPEQNRPYQGYPFVNPVVIDVPTVDAATAAKWANLPRKPIGTPNQKTTSKSPKNDNPSIYIEIPSETGSSSVTQPGTSRDSTKKEDVPVVYIQVPDDIENSGDAISANQQDRGQENPGFIQETIFYDPFENRQIDLNKPKEQGSSVPGTSTANPGSSSASRPAPNVPEPNTRPNLNLNLQGSIGGSSTPSTNISGFMNKESQIYGSSSPDDGFTLTPLPVTDYPEPPPAYTEVAPTTHDRPGQPSQATPPRTVVVVPETSPTVGQPSLNRKFVQCQSCGLMVHTVVVNENGAFTHFVALITVILCILPVTVVVYCTDFFKYRVHFCPNCHHSVGYEIPILCQDLVYNGR